MDSRRRRRLFAGGEAVADHQVVHDGDPEVDEDELFATVERLRKILNNHVGIIELAEELDIETVTEIFIRVNSAGAALSQADFAMSKIAANETYGGNQLRKAIDYFCHLAVAPEFHRFIEKNDLKFAKTDLYRQMRWLRDVNDDIYDPSYTDMLRVAFTSEFRRGKLQDLVALLSGRNFETKQYEEEIAERSFARLGEGISRFINQTHFDRITMILRSAGFVTRNLFSGQNAINFAYILYLRGRAESMEAAELERLVRRWYVMSILTRRYTKGNPETDIDFDIRQIESHGLRAFTESAIEAALTYSFWTTLLSREMDTSASRSPYFLVYKAAQVKQGDLGFLSRDITVRDLVLNRGDAHHIYPRNHLKQQGLTWGRYNQIANFAICQSEINIAIGDKAPERYLHEIAEQANGGERRYGGITDRASMEKNFVQHCVPVGLLDGDVPPYDVFLAKRRGLMAEKIRGYFESL